MSGLDTTFREVLAGNPDDDFIEVDGVWQTRRASQDIAREVKAAMDAASVAADAPVGLIARNRPPQLGALFGLLAERRTIVMLHAYQSPRGLADEMRRLRLAVVIGDTQDMGDPEIAAAAEECGTLALMLTGQVDAPVSTVNPAGAGPHHAPQPDIAIQMLTSGTTGTPKRVPISYTMLESAVADAGLATQQAGTAFSAAPYIQIYPLGNISGLYGLITAVSNGQSVVLLEKFKVDGWVRAVSTYRPTTFVSLPPAALRMVMDADVPREAISSIPVMRCGSAPLDPELQQAFEARYGIPILINYGATEFCGVIANWTIDSHRAFATSKRGSVGQARPGISLRITDPENDAEVPAGTVGRLEVLAPRVSSDWVRTTDLALIDGDGFLFLKGRADSMIIRGGFKVSPDAIAEVLRAHPSIREAVVVGLPDQRLGEVPVAALELEDGAEPLSEQDLAVYARVHLSPQQVPTRFLFVDALPRTQSMKVDRGASKALMLQSVA